jgi:hypothetical protein
MKKYRIKINKKLNILKCLNITNSRSDGGGGGSGGDGGETQVCTYQIQ